MAREQRKDVDYFPHACSHGRKMHIIENKYGNDGYAVWFKLLEQLGKANNHYLDISDEMNLMFLVSIFKCEKNVVLEILTDLSKLGAIDSELFEQHQIIFSEKFSESVSDAYRKRKNQLFTRNDIFTSILHQSTTNPQEIDGSYSQASGQSAVETHITPGDIRKEKDRIGEDRKEENIYISEIEFIKIWSNARMYYDKNKTGFDNLLPFEKQCFNQLKDNYTEEQFKHAVAGLFFQDTLPAVRVRPKHFLEPENFTKYLDCWVNQRKIFDSKKNENQLKQSKFQKGDV